MKRVATTTSKLIGWRSIPKACPVASFSSLRTTKYENKRMVPSRRSFSTAAEQLHELLVGELEFEKTQESPKEEEEELERVIHGVTAHFTIQETPGLGKVVLSRTYEDEEIIVEFNCQHEIDSGQTKPFEVDEDGVGPGEEEMEKMDGAAGVSFEITITRGDSKMFFNCLALENLEICLIQHMPKDTPIDERTVFGGPHFDHLPETVQKAMYGYLSERGIDDYLAQFVATYGVKKEDDEYQTWLQNVSTFIS